MDEKVDKTESVKSKKQLPVIGDNRLVVILSAIAAITLIACVHMWLSKVADDDLGYTAYTGMSLIAGCAGVSAWKNAIPGMSNPKG